MEHITKSGNICAIELQLVILLIYLYLLCKLQYSEHFFIL